MTDTVPRASGLALLSAGLGLLLGAAALWVGLGDGAIAQWAFGTACLLQVPPALSLRSRIRDGLGNSGLDRPPSGPASVGQSNLIARSSIS